MKNFIVLNKFLIKRMEELEGTNIEYNSGKDNSAIPNYVFEELNSHTGRNIPCIIEKEIINEVLEDKIIDKINMMENGIERSIQIHDSD